jgi:hypothetical protein
MSIVRCPRCRDEVTVPAKATGKALVRCPLCLEEYLLAEALANAPPPLVIIGGEVEQAAITSAADEYRLAGAPFSAAALDSSAPAGSSALAPRPAVRAMPRPRRQEKGGGVLLLVNYALGGVLGLSLGLLVLWWGFRRDPLELGPPISRYAPFLVPAEFQGAASANIDSTMRPSAPSSSTAASESGGEGQPPAERPGAQKKRNGKRATAAFEPKEPPAELQTLPGFDEPAKLPGDSLTPTIDAPALKDPGASRSPVNELLNELPKSASATVELSDEEARPSPRPPMPDLTDLLPDGP